MIEDKHMFIYKYYWFVSKTLTRNNTIVTANLKMCSFPTFDMNIAAVF